MQVQGVRLYLSVLRAILQTSAVAGDVEHFKYCSATKQDSSNTVASQWREME